MCYGSDCKNEIKSGPNHGECGGGFCPPDLEEETLNEVEENHYE